LVGAFDRPVRLRHQQKLVYSPHLYGPTVFEQPYLDKGEGFLNELWTRLWGRLALYDNSDQTQSSLPPISVPETHIQTAILIGAMGSRYNTAQDREWQTSVMRYALENEIGAIYWALNPEGDTGGLLADDWTTPDVEKLEMLGGFKSTPLARAVMMSPPSPASPPLLRLAPEPPPAADPPAAVPPAPPPPPPPPDPPLWPGALIDSSSLTGRQHGYDCFAQGAQEFESSHPALVALVAILAVFFGCCAVVAFFILASHYRTLRRAYDELSEKRRANETELASLGSGSEAVLEDDAHGLPPVGARVVRIVKSTPPRGVA